MKVYWPSESPTGPLAVTDGNVDENSSRQQDTRDERRDREKPSVRDLRSRLKAGVPTQHALASTVYMAGSTLCLRRREPRCLNAEEPHVARAGHSEYQGVSARPR